MATKQPTATVLPSNEAIWSGRRVAVPKTPKVKRIKANRVRGKKRS